MPRIKRIAKNIATLVHPTGLAGLLRARLGVVAAFTERGEAVEVRKRIAASFDRLAMVNGNCRLDLSVLHARFTQRIALQLLLP